MKETEVKDTEEEEMEEKGNMGKQTEEKQTEEKEGVGQGEGELRGEEANAPVEEGAESPVAREETGDAGEGEVKQSPVPVPHEAAEPGETVPSTAPVNIPAADITIPTTPEIPPVPETAPAPAPAPIPSPKASPTLPPREQFLAEVITIALSHQSRPSSSSNHGSVRVRGGVSRSASDTSAVIIAGSTPSPSSSGSGVGTGGAGSGTGTGGGATFWGRIKRRLSLGGMRSKSAG